MFCILKSGALFQLSPAASSSPSQRSTGHVEEDKCNDDAEVYQQVKYFRQSIHEVNQLLGEPGCDVLDSNGRLGGKCGSEVVETGVSEESVEAEGCDVPQGCSFVETFCKKQSTEDSEDREPGDREQLAGCAESGGHCDVPTGTGVQTALCRSAENCVKGRKFGESVIEDCVLLQIKTSERQMSSCRNEPEDSPVCASLESPQLSPEHRRLTILDPNPNRRKFESEIGRDIVRERRMRQELEEMRIANQG